jgi:hypothetical protein
MWLCLLALCLLQYATADSASERGHLLLEDALHSHFNRVRDLVQGGVESYQVG